MRLRKPIGWVLFVAVLLATALSPVLAGYEDHFKAGIAAQDLKKWKEAIGLFEKAVAQQPRAGGSLVRISGMRFEDYTPYYYLSVAYHKVGNNWKSRQNAEISKREGVLGSKGRKKLDNVWVLVKNAKDPNKKEPQQDQKLVARAKDEFGKSAALESQLQKKMKSPGFNQLVPELKSGTSDWIADRGRVRDRLARAKTDGDFQSIESEAKDLNKRAPLLIGKIDDGLGRMEARKLDAARNRVARSRPEAGKLGDNLTPQRVQALKKAALWDKWQAADKSLAEAQRLEASSQKSNSLKDLDRAGELYEGVTRDRKFLIDQADQLIAGKADAKDRLELLAKEAALAVEPTNVAVVPEIEKPVEPTLVGLLNEPHPRLVDAYDAYTSTRYDDVESVLAGVKFEEPWLEVQANLFLAAAFHARYVRGGKQDESLRKKAQQSVDECLKLDPNYSPRREVFPPPFLSFYGDS